MIFINFNDFIVIMKLYVNVHYHVRKNTYMPYNNR